MLDNHVYNLFAQMVEEHQSLYRIKNNYQADAGSCEQCTAFWEKMEADKEDHIEELDGLIKAHLEMNE